MQEEDFHHYCASLFSVPVSRGSLKPEITTPGSCLAIEVLDEVRMAKVENCTYVVHKVILGRANKAVETHYCNTST